MLRLTVCELRKLKKSNILWIIIAGAFFSAFVTFVQFVMAQNIDLQAGTFEDFYLAAIWNNFCVAFPFVITILGGMIFNQEYRSGTLKSILTIPISIQRLYFAKIFVIGILVLALSAINHVFLIIGAVLLQLQGISSFHLLKSFLQIFGIAVFIFIAVLPLIIWGFRKVNGYYPMLIVAFMYGFFGSLLIPKGFGDFYPITAGLRIMKYAVLPKGSSSMAFITVAIMIFISISIICFVPYSYEKAAQSSKKVNVKKRHS